MSHRHIPIIGLLGGIASGKSHYARSLARLGCEVVSADDLVAEVYRLPEVISTLRQWWGEDIVSPEGMPDRPAIARKVFSNPDERSRLESLLHPKVFERLDRRMDELRTRQPAPAAIVWDIPLLLETGSEPACDLLVFVDTPEPTREVRAVARGWAPGELRRREQSQVPLEVKRQRSHLQVPGDAGDAEVEMASRHILAKVGVG